jgi:DNA-directed RNA polymerase subunit M/transcription elongation factor TFIIS
MKVKVSSHYHGKGWFDPKSRIEFTKEAGVIEVPDGAKMDNINRYINRNYLVVLDDGVVVEEKTNNNGALSAGKLLVNDKPKTEKKEEPVEVEEEVIEVKEEPEETVEEEVESDEEEDEPKVNDNGKVECQYCGKEYSPRGIANHEKACKENPENK